MAKTAVPTFSSEVRADPVAFGEKFLHNPDGTPLVYHDAQRAMLRNIGPITVCCCGRQSGKSFGLAGYIAWYMVTHPYREVMIVAPTLDQARIIFSDVERYFREDLLKLFVEGKVKHAPFPELKLLNGSMCYARGGNNPENIRGHHPHLVIIDEAAFVKDDVIINTLLPMMTVTLKQKDSAIIVISTPFANSEFENMFRRAQEDKSGFMRWHKFTSLDNPHRDQRFLDMIRNQWGEDSVLWQTEYMAEFSDGDMSVFPSRDIKWALDNHPFTTWPVKPMPNHLYYQGVDLANARDYFAAAIFDGTNPELNHMVKLHRVNRRGYAHYKRLVRQEWENYYHPQTLLDATSMGESVVEDLADINAEGYTIGSSTQKYELIQELARMLNERRLTIPNEKAIIDELRYFTYSYTKSKQLRMEASQGHDDIVLAMSFAARLASRTKKIGFFTGVDFVPRKKPGQKAKPGEPGYIDPIAELFKLD